MRICYCVGILGALAIAYSVLIFVVAAGAFLVLYAVVRFLGEWAYGAWFQRDPPPETDPAKMDAVALYRYQQENP